MIRVRQLCGGGLYRDVPYWIDTLFCGVRLDTARRWLKHNGWGVYSSWEYCDFLKRHVEIAMHAPLRLRLRGRCWIEDVDHPAVFCRDAPDRARPDGERFAGIVPPMPPAPQWETFVRPRRRAKAKSSAAVTLGRKGGLARAGRLSKEERSAIARAAAQRRWAKRNRERER